MRVPYRHIRHQTPVIASLGQTLLTALFPKLARISGKDSAVTALLPARSPALVRDYVREVGGDTSSYRKTVPPHMFPQWGFALQAKTLRGIQYPLAKVMNGGCRLEINGPLPLNEPLNVTARLADIDDNGRRAVLHQIVTTGTRSQPSAVVAHLYAIVPLAQRKGTAKGKKRERPRVPDGAREIARWRLSHDSGLAFALLTGDFNPIHWIAPYAKAAGFKNTILHGFATLARTMEGLNRSLFAGDVRALSVIDVKFTRPLVLPANVGLYVDDHAVFVGEMPGGPAYMTGTFSTENNDE